ncbi:ATP-binding protein [Oscillatoriales cyanobacterium LEGE 11467]|uniref:ATP-binding protein n=1 Tax=Zarconia navalis LEGE 11467 TaxID=1828826 RepID=A0A928VYG4_9CYAN|nr:ATP-binding protein [Zarconia navalis]MBE9041598.1 ATP-binding protein [Zarconia navalis LEGE 11467]
MANLIDNLYNAFDPSQPLPANDPRYVDFQAVRGDTDVRVDVGRSIKRSDRMTCQLYTGHRGGGKSTELRRLQAYLIEQNFHVVYFEADEEDIDPEDTQYTDILLACTRRLIEDLNQFAKPTPLLDWLQSRWQEVKELALSEVEFQKMTVEAQIAQFAKLTANLRTVPSLRHQIRTKVESHTVTLLKALNEFIGEAKQNLPDGETQLAVIVDNLDRIVPVPQASGQLNHEEIFLDRSEQLRALDCHVVYTVPISMVYSKRATDLREIYDGDETNILPMVMVHSPEGEVYEPGLAKMKEAIARRVARFAPDAALVEDIFESEETLNGLCLMSGGHIRNLMLLAKAAIGQTNQFPITQTSVKRSITKLRDTYRRTVQAGEWELLAKVANSKQIDNSDEYRSLLFNRCLLEYCYYDDEGELQRWYDVHPLMRGIREFKDAVAKLEQ